MSKTKWMTGKGLAGIGLLMMMLILSGCSVESVANPTEAEVTDIGDQTESGQEMQEPTEETGPREYNVPPEDAALANPIEADEASLERGREIYESSCLKCHGEEGRGDGPSATNPVDFREEFVVELSDGEIFYLITNGVEGADMWAFNFLDEDQRWHLVNYIRSLQE